jgi:hypothetical protein
VLYDINLAIKLETTIPLAGRSGAGKITITKLLMRFYRPGYGRITIEGFDLQELKIESLRSQFGIILQDDSLISGTSPDNLTPGLLRKVSNAELQEDTRSAHVPDFIQAQPPGIKTVLKECGQREPVRGTASALRKCQHVPAPAEDFHHGWNISGCPITNLRRSPAGPETLIARARYIYYCSPSQLHTQCRSYCHHCYRQDRRVGYS